FHETPCAFESVRAPTPLPSKPLSPTIPPGSTVKRSRPAGLGGQAGRESTTRPVLGSEKAIPVASLSSMLWQLSSVRVCACCAPPPLSTGIIERRAAPPY